MQPTPRTLIPAILAASLIVVGCGSATSHSTQTTDSTATTASANSSTAASTTTRTDANAAPDSLAATSQSAATGDVPDNQNFLTYTSTTSKFSLKYPEGWSRQPSANGVIFQDKNNVARVTITSGGAPTVASVTAALSALQSKHPTLQFDPPQTTKVQGTDMIKTTYSTQSDPNPVTGKRVKLLVDRYDLSQGTRVATVELGTPDGVDNVDAFRLMIESFAWT